MRVASRRLRPALDTLLSYLSGSDWDYDKTLYRTAVDERMAFTGHSC